MDVNLKCKRINLTSCNVPEFELENGSRGFSMELENPQSMDLEFIDMEQEAFIKIFNEELSLGSLQDQIHNMDVDLILTRLSQSDEVYETILQWIKNYFNKEEIKELWEEIQ